MMDSPTIQASGGANCPSRFEGVPNLSWNPSEGSTKALKEGSMKPPERSRREDVAKTSRCRCEGESPLRRSGCSTKPSRSSREVLLNPPWRSVFAKASRSPHGAFMKHSRNWLAVAKGSRHLYERFVKTSRALKASRRDREAFAKPSRSLHPF